MKLSGLPSFFAAMDDSEEQGVLKKARMIKNVQGNFGPKLNLDLVYGNLDIIDRVAQLLGRPVFVDNKMWNGKRTMAEVIKKLARHNVSMTNIYAHADTMAMEAINIANEADIIVLGTTILTHYTNDYCKKVYRRSIGGAVKVLSEMAVENGCHGVILPGTTLKHVKHLSCIKFNPAVRPMWFADKKANFQEQEMQPGEAIRRGTDIVSCGSPIFKSPDPAEALSRILEEISSAKK